MLLSIHFFGENYMKENQRVTITKRMLREGLLRLLEEKPIDKISCTCICVAAIPWRVLLPRCS